MLELLELLKHSSAQISRSIKLCSPTKEVLSVPNNKNHKYMTWKKFSIQRNNSVEWKLDTVSTDLALNANSQMLSQFSNTIQQVDQECVESVFGTTNNEITLWWSLS